MADCNEIDVNVVEAVASMKDLVFMDDEVIEEVIV